MAWRTIWTKHKVLLGWFRSSPGHLISLPPAVGAVQRRVGPGLQQCCPLIVTGLRHPILLLTGLSYRVPEPCGPSSPRPGPAAQRWQSPQGGGPGLALSSCSPGLRPLPLTLTPSPPAPGQEPHNTAECCLGPAAPEAFNSPFPWHQLLEAAGGVAGTALLQWDRVFKAAGKDHGRHVSCWAGQGPISRAGGGCGEQMESVLEREG